MKRVLQVAVLALAVASLPACAKRQIDPRETGSVPVHGTHGTLQRFCDGGVAIYWTPGRGGESDDYEFLVYEHPDCVGATGVRPRIEDIPDEEN